WRGMPPLPAESLVPSDIASSASDHAEQRRLYHRTPNRGVLYRCRGSATLVSNRSDTDSASAANAVMLWVDYELGAGMRLSGHPAHAPCTRQAVVFLPTATGEPKGSVTVTVYVDEAAGGI